MYNPDDVWSLFGLLKAAERVHLDLEWSGVSPWHSPNSKHEVANPPPPDGLFPNASYVALSRNWTLHIALKILHTPSRIVSLSVIYGYSQIPGLLSALTGKCTRLRRISLKKASQTAGHEPFHEENGETIILEWRNFLKSTKSSLESVDLCLSRRDYGCFYYEDEVDMRDAVFADGIMPVFLEEGWVDLKVLTLRGINLKKADEMAILSSLPAIEVRWKPHSRAWEDCEEAFQTVDHPSCIWEGGQL